jgi:hypothetical protein
VHTRRYLALVIALTAVGAAATAFAESAEELRNRILTQTKVVVTELTTPAREYKECLTTGKLFFSTRPRTTRSS